MKLIPYLRFTLGVFVLINFLSRINSNKTGLRNFDIFATGFSGLLIFTFLLYCLLEGLQELRNMKLIQAKYFRTFGLFFEVLIFLSGLFILVSANGYLSPWWFALIVIFQVIGVLTLVIIDIKKIRLN